MLTRRSMFGGLLTLVAPAIIRTPGLLMPIKPVLDTTSWLESASPPITYQLIYSNRELGGTWYWWSANGHGGPVDDPRIISAEHEHTGQI